jgi:hypothetical protein
MTHTWFPLPPIARDATAKNQSSEAECRISYPLMRRSIALQCSLALATAFVLAPFQHVHRDGAAGDHTHAPLIHSHLYEHHHDHAGQPHVDKPGEREIESVDEDEATSLDTFTLVLSSAFSPFVPLRAPALIHPPTETRASFELVEECGHDPPPSRNSPPRAPPV